MGLGANPNFVRERLNREHNPEDFMFVMRTTTNGMPRYNSNGDFNNSFHLTRNGIIPEKLNDIIMKWNSLIQFVEFENKSFEVFSPNESDFMYLDPPYANINSMYFGKFDNDKLWEFLRHHRECSYILSYDGISGNVDNTYCVPKDLYDTHLYIKSGNSSFKRTIGKDKCAMVYESLYLKGV